MATNVVATALLFKVLQLPLFNIHSIMFGVTGSFLTTPPLKFFMPLITLSPSLQICCARSGHRVLPQGSTIRWHSDTLWQCCACCCNTQTCAARNEPSSHWCLCLSQCSTCCASHPLSAPRNGSTPKSTQNATHSYHLWLSRVKYRVRVVFRWFELEARLCPMGGEALAMRSLEL